MHNTEATIQQYVCHLQEGQSCNIPLSLHLEIEWTKYGSLVNPQAQVVSIKEVIQTNTTSLVRLTITVAGHETLEVKGLSMLQTNCCCLVLSR